MLYPGPRRFRPMSPFLPDIILRRWLDQRMLSRSVHRICCGLVLCGICAIAGINGFAQTASRQQTAAQAGGVADPKLAARVESILKQMTVEEKVGQLVQYSAG